MEAWQTAFVVYGIAAIISFFTAGLIKLIVVLLGLAQERKQKAKA